MMKWNNIFWLFCFVIVVKQSVLHTKSEVTVTVLVHGTYPALKLLAHNYSPFRSWVYAKPGLSLAKDLPLNYYFHQLVYKCHAKDEQGFNVNHFYTYGWHSSNIRPKQRENEGAKLYNDLKKVLKKYKEQYDNVNLRLIGVSHGGNVVLNCINQMPFYLDGVETEVVLLATPVQESTRRYVNNSAVKRVYSFYSNADWMQCLDMQKCHKDAPKGCPFWSQRTFSEEDRVVQICLKINGSYIGHSRYRFIAHHFPEILKIVDQKIHNKDKAHLMLDFKIG